MSRSDAILSALVVLRSESGDQVGEEAQITSETIKEYVPSDEAILRVTTHFERAGFEVGPFIGISCSIAAAQKKFEQVFGTDIVQDEAGGFLATREDGSNNRELPLGLLPESLVPLIDVVTFELPADLHSVETFGP